MMVTASVLSSLLILSLISLPLPTTEAFPQAVGACPGGVAAVEGSFHTTEGKTITTGPLSDANLVVSLNGVALVANTTDNPDVSTSFPVNEESILEISTSDSSSFKGFLMRVGHPPTNVVDLRQSIEPVSSNDTTTQVSELQCVETQQVGGLMHTSNDDKTSIAGSLFVTVPVEGILLDVTVVLVNDATTSTYYYSRFLLDAVAVEGEEESTESMPAEDSAATMTPSTETTDMPSMVDNDTAGSNATTDGESTPEEGTEGEGEELPSTTDEAPPNEGTPPSGSDHHNLPSEGRVLSLLLMSSLFLL